MAKRKSSLSRPSWHEIFTEATILFSKRSSCAKDQQAALLIKDNRIISFGVNGAPAGTLNCDDEGGEEVCGKDSNGSCFLGAAGIKEFYYLTEYRLDDGIRFLEYCGIKTWKIEN